MPRFFVNRESITDNTVMIAGDDSRHIARSLRMAVGDRVIVCDGSGDELLCRLAKIRDDITECEILSRGKSIVEPPYQLALFMGYPKGDKLETVIQKAVELGATKIVPFESSRCVKRPDIKKSGERLPRLKRIAEEAAKQCGRATVPTVSLPLSFDEMLAQASKYQLALFCYEAEQSSSIKEQLSYFKLPPSSICVVIGSEGGFSEEEAQTALSSGLLSVSLGKRILRCETAPDYALSAISYHFEL